MDTNLSTPRDRAYSWGTAIGLHVAILLVLLFFANFRYPDPPLGSDTISVSLARRGNSQSAAGQTRKGTEVENQQPTPTPQQNQPSQPAPVETQPVTTTSEQSSVSVSEPTTTSTQTQEETTPEPDPEPERTVDSRLNDAFGTLSGGGNSQNDGETSGTGIEGTSDGKIEGRGVIGDDKPYGFNLSGRGQIGEPAFDNSHREEGLIVIDIYVNRNGEITETKWNRTLSTSASYQLFLKAQEALSSVRFDSNPGAPMVQKGQFTVNFTLK